MANDPQVNEKWRYKPNRGLGVFTIVEVRETGRVKLRSTLSGKTKTVALRTLRGDYERVDLPKDSRR